MLFADITATIVLGYFYKSIFVSTEYDNAFGFIAIALIIYVIALIMQNFKNIKGSNPVSKIYWISSVVIPVSSVFLMILILGSANLNQTAVVIAVVVILFINMLTFYLYDSLSAAYADKLKSKLSEQEKEYYYNQCELMRNTIDEIKAYRHDNKNHLTAVNDFIRNNQTEKAGEYLSKLIDYVQTDTIYSDTGNTAFDSIINYKLRNAKENNIELKIDVSVPHELNMDVADIVTITGNLLDNAINATLKANEKRITLKVSYNKGRVLIYTENTFNGEVKTTNDSKDHGFGLRNVQKSVDKYNGLLELNNMDSIFTVNVLLYVSMD
jgi:signal transduction histidine kinase